MATAYEIFSPSSPKLMKRVECKNEETELQDLLERCPDLMPGAQIDPKSPRRWLQIQREMPVPNPGTGTDHWNIDFLFADQDAIPTFVEVKRYADTRSRREVIGQMFEYAANGQYYWTGDGLKQAAERSATKNKKDFIREMSNLQPSDAQEVDDFFVKLESNLREGKMRLVFFLEKAPPELKSLVEFLNRQLINIEVLLIEAQIFEDSANKRIVIPTLFGYIEPARKIRALVESGNAATRNRSTWDEVSFFNKAQDVLADKPGAVSALRELYEFGNSRGWTEWSAGSYGAFNFRERRLCSSVFMAVRADGNLEISFASLLNTTAVAGETLSWLVKELTALGFPVPSDAVSKPKWPSFNLNIWLSRKDKLIEILQQLNQRVATTKVETESIGTSEITHAL